MSDKPVLFKYAGHEVRLTSNYEFEISGPAFDSDNSARYDTAQKAKEAIDRRNKTLTRQNRAKAEISLPVIASNGDPCTIRGIHMNTSELLGVPKNDGASARVVYPPETWIAEAIKRHNRLEQELEGIRSRLYYVEINGGYGRIEEYEYDDKIQQLKRRYEDAVKTAREIALKQEAEQ